VVTLNFDQGELIEELLDQRLRAEPFALAYQEKMIRKGSNARRRRVCGLGQREIAGYSRIDRAGCGWVRSKAATRPENAARIQIASDAVEWKPIRPSDSPLQPQFQNRGRQRRSDGVIRG
jgi:hypothetical protein